MEYVEKLDRAECEAFLRQRTEANFLQSWQWGAAHEALGDTIVRNGITEDGKVVAAWTGIVKDARRGRYLEVPGGPIMDWTDEALAKEVVKRLKETGKKHACVFVRLRPQAAESAAMCERLAALKLHRAPFHLHAEHTNILDIMPTEDELLAGMRRQTRYEVRRVAKRGVMVTASTPTEAEIDEFYDLQAETARRHHFVQSPRAFFHALAGTFGDQLQLYRAEKGGTLLNLALVIHSGKEVDYYEAASTVDARKEPGAYGVVWRAIQAAKQRGCTRFNFWGIAYSDNPEHRYAGVTTFKRGFGGEDVSFVPAHDIVLKHTYAKTWLIETIRKKRRKLS